MSHAREPSEVERFADGLQLPETPRWHDGALWISDMWDHAVVRFDATGARTDVVRFDDSEDPGGLGWLPDGSMLVVGMEARCLHRIDRHDNRTVHADLRSVAPWQCNDMIVRSDGTAFVSHFGYDMWGGTTGFLPATLVRVRPDGAIDVVADDLLAPNGMALPDDEATLYLSECGRSNVLAFDIADDGGLTNRRVHAVLPLAPGTAVAPPDGICLDESGAVWTAEPLGQRVMRLDRDGSVTDEIAFDQSPLAVVLGGDDRRTLFVCSSAEHDKPHRSGRPTGRIDALRVDVPGAGRP